MSSTPAFAPILSVPEIVFPQTEIDHKAAVEQVAKLYEPLCAQRRDDPEYQREFVSEVALGLRMAANLDIDAHPVHLRMDQMARPRGLRARNGEAQDAFNTYVPVAAERALATSGTKPADIDAVLVSTSTVIAMPVLAYDVVDMVGLRPSVEVIPINYMGCNGGAHAVLRAYDYLLAHPDHTVLIIAADYASPHFHLEPELRGIDLRGSVVSSTLFSDGTAAAVMSARDDAVGFKIMGTASHRLPGSRGALSWEVADDGLHFRLADGATKLVPQVLPILPALLDQQGWRPEDLAVCSFHTGGNRIIDDVRDGLGLTDDHVSPTRQALRRGNTMSVAIFDTLRIIASDSQYRPLDTARGLGAGFGPGFSCSAFTWQFQDLAESRQREESDSGSINLGDGWRTRANPAATVADPTATVGAVPVP